MSSRYELLYLTIGLSIIKDRDELFLTIDFKKYSAPSAVFIRFNKDTSPIFFNSSLSIVQKNGIRDAKAKGRIIKNEVDNFRILWRVSST